MNISLARFYKNSNGWDLATLSDKEMETIHHSVRRRNAEILSECIEDAKSIARHHELVNNYNWDTTLKMALQLFERRTVHISVILDAVLKQKTFRVDRGYPENSK